MGAILFVCLLVISVLFCILVWVYLSRCVTVVVEETAAGNEELIWPDDPPLDWIAVGVYMAWLVGIWLVPSFFVARLATRHLEFDSKLWVYVGSLLAVFWLTFPVSLLSTMSAESRFAIFHAGLIRRLSANFGNLAVFYLASGLLVAVCIPLLAGLMSGGDPVTVIVGGLGLGTAAFLIARMLGRVACLARLTEFGRKKRTRKRKTKGVAVEDPWEHPEDEIQDDVAPPEEEPTDRETTHFIQPSELPALHTPYEGDVTGYNVDFESKPVDRPAPKKRRRRPAEDDEPVPMRRDEAAEKRIAEEKEQSRQRAREIVPDKVELDRLRRKLEQIPRRPPLSGIGLFLFQKGVVVHWVALSLGIGLLGVCVRGLIMMWPN